MSQALSVDRDFIRVRSSAIHGQGVFAYRPIPKGTRVVAYGGERVLKERLLEEVERGLRALTYVLNLDEETAIDGAVGGTEARFLNHSCAPNCEVYIFDGVPYLYAMEDIAEGAELTFDYKLQSVAGGRASARLCRALFPCRCGAPDCRGTLAALAPLGSAECAEEP
jgi:uncharacterized protein